MVLRSDTKTASNGVKKRSTRLSKLKSHLPFLCSCFKSSGKQRRDMITTANRGQIVLVPKSSFERLKPHKVSNRKNRYLIKKEGFYQLLPDSLHPLLLIYLESFSNETRTKDDAGSRTFIAES